MLDRAVKIPSAEAMDLQSLLGFTDHGIASRIVAKAPAANLTLFALDAGQGLTEHTSPFEALVLVLAGSLVLTIGGVPVRAPAGSIVWMPAAVPHAVEARERAKMLLVMLREQAP